MTGLAARLSGKARSMVARASGVVTPGEYIRRSSLFDPGFVRDQLRDRELAGADMETLAEALAGRRELFSVSPSPLFDPAFYVERYVDVAGYGAHPFVHFLRHGFVEGRRPHPLVDLYWLAWTARRAGVSLTPLLASIFP